MKSLLIFALTLLLATPVVSQEHTSTETTTYYFIRHAEKDTSDSKNRDPNLIEAGILRAKKWSDVLKHIKFDAIYSTEYNRTKQTAQSTAKTNHLEITLYNPRTLNDPSFAEQTKGKTVLVVGHSNTTPAFVNAIIGDNKYKDIDHNNNANLYIVTISPKGDITDALLVVE